MLRLQEFINHLRTSKDKASESAFIESELAAIKCSFQKNEPKFRARNIAKLLFIQLNGQKIDFGYSQSIDLINCSFLIEKRIGYLALVHLSSSETLFSAVQSIKRDLRSKNPKVMGLSLCALASICQSRPQIFRYLEEQMINCVKFPNQSIQKKAILTISKLVKHSPGIMTHYQINIINAMRLNQHHLLPQCLIYFHNATQSGRNDSQKFVQLIPQMIELYSARYQCHQDSTNQLGNRFVFQSLMKFLQLHITGNQKIQSFFTNFFAQIIESHRRDLQKEKNLIFVSYSLLRYAVSLSVNQKSHRLVRVLVQHILSLKNANFAYISLSSLEMASRFDFQILASNLKVVLSCLQSKDLTIRSHAVALLFKICEKNQKITREQREYFESVIEIVEIVQSAKQLPKRKYCAIIQVLILIIQSGRNSFVSAILQEVQQNNKLMKLSLVCLFFQPNLTNPFDTFFLIMTSILEQWTKSVDSVQYQLDSSHTHKQFSTDTKITLIIQSLYSLQHVPEDSVTLKISLLYKISHKLLNKQKIRQIIKRFTDYRSQKIQKEAHKVLAEFDESFPRSMSGINQSSIRLAQRKQSSQRLNSSSDSAQELENLAQVCGTRLKEDDQSHLLRELQEKQELTIKVRSDKVIPVKIQLALHQVGCTQMELGNCRVLQVLYYSGNDDRNTDSYKNVTERAIQFETNPQGIVRIDQYGRLTTLKPGNVQITVNSISNKQATDTKRICVINKKLTKKKFFKKRIGSYLGQPIDQYSNLQKIVYRYSNNHIEGNSEIPIQVKRILSSEKPKIMIREGPISWSIEKFADGSSGRYIKRTDQSMQESNKDKVQYFIGERYLPGDGKSPHSIQYDGSNGIWVIGENGDINHISMTKIGYADKAFMMTKDTEKYVMRFGLVSNSSWNGSRWVPPVSDNDGLWTGMYSVGQLMKYHTLKKSGASSRVIKEARQSALKTLKAVLLIANVSGRDGVVKARIRYLTNTRIGDAFWFSDDYLKQGKPLMIDNFVGSPAEGIGFYGVDAGKDQGHYVGGSFRYSLKPFNPDDYTKTQKPALTQRTLKGYISRSFSIFPLQHWSEGLSFRRNADGTQTVLSSADTLYDYGKQDHPVLKLGNLPIPQVLKDVLFVNGKQYGFQDLVYKADCSNDEIIGHLFVYKVAFDILDEADQEQRAVKQLVRDTVVNYAQHILENNYILVDATGQGTKWGKNTRDWLGNDHSIQQGNMHCLVLMMTFKLAYYCSGQIRWQDEYLLLANHKAFRYLDLSTHFWEEWMYIGLNQDQSPEDNNYRLRKQDNPSEVQKFAHFLYTHNYSDQEMAMLVFYLCLELEDDQRILEKYRKALDCWWRTTSFSQNPLWYYIYQLSRPKQKILDSFGNQILSVAAWQLNRHPINMINYQAYIEGSRPDVLRDVQIAIDPHKKLGTRTSKTDKQNADIPMNYKIYPDYDPNSIYQIKVLPADERSIHKFNNTNFRNIHSGNKNDMEAATLYTLPYWFGIYHGMLRFHPPTSI